MHAAASAAREAGVIILRRPRPSTVRSKSNARDLVSEIDRRAELLIRRRLTKAFPRIPVIGEEGDQPGDVIGLRWYVDPLDGTVNHVHGVPHFAVSIACGDEQRALAGAIYDPSRRQLFTAVLGGGAFVNGRRLRTSATRRLADSLLATGFPYDRTGPDNNVDRFTRLLLVCHGVRRLGAACLDLAYVAAGWFDGYWEMRLNAWDFAAGALLVEEAGGRMTTVSGEPLSMHSRAVLASNGHLHAKLVASLQDPPASEPGS
jgi:myo-inositol-1(or 4)-monophosphatase